MASIGKFGDFFKKSKSMLSTPKELPSISPPKALPEPTKNTAPAPPSTITVKTETPVAETRRQLILPIVETPKSTEIMLAPPRIKDNNNSHAMQEETRAFDDAIMSIHKGFLNESPEEEPQKIQQPNNQPTSHDPGFYKPKETGEGYFSEIKHYLENKDIHAILDDLLKKDMLTSMKDYHDQQTQGKPYYIHSHDLQNKLERKMHALMHMEQEWHDLQKLLDEKNHKKTILEKEIDEEAQDLKELFSLIRSSEILSKQAPQSQEFTLINGQKLKTLNDLRKALSYMKQEEYSHHVSADKNDFANWVANSLNLIPLADKMRQIHDKQELENLLRKPIISNRL